MTHPRGITFAQGQFCKGCHVRGNVDLSWDPAVGEQTGVQHAAVDRLAQLAVHTGLASDQNEHGASDVAEWAMIV